MNSVLRRTSLTVIIGCFLYASVPVLADEGSTILPMRECQGKKIECTTWFESPRACDAYLNNPEYFVAGGSVGASVQHYTFCKKSSEEKGDKKNSWYRLISRENTLSFAAASLLIIAGVVLVRYIRKKNV